MSVQPGPTDKRYAANGVALVYTVPFLVIEAGDLQVYLNGSIITSGFVHSGIGNPSSTLTFTTPPVGDLYLLLNVPFQRLVDYQENGDFLSSTVNRDFDRIWQALKQLYAWANRSLRLGVLDVDGAGWYRAKGNGITGLASAAAVDDAAVNYKDVKDLLASILETGQGPINNAANIIYLDPDNNIFVVQDMSKAGPTKGANLLYLDDIRRHITFRGDDTIGHPHMMYGRMETATIADTIFLEHVGTGPSASGYGVHVLDSGVGDNSVPGNGGGAIGGATSRTTDASAIVGNRRDTGPGNGGIFSRLESGGGHGAYGFRAGSGAGSGIFGYLVQAAQGHGVHGKHEGTFSGAGVFGERLNGAGEGPGVLGHAAGSGSGIENASIMGFKLAGETSPAGLFDGRGVHAALRAFSATSTTAKAIDSQSDVTATAPVSNTFARDYGASGVCVSHRVNGAGPRTGPVFATTSAVSPSVLSTGSATVTGHGLTITSNVSGSAEAIGASYDVLSVGGAASNGVKAVVNGANTTNYAVYGNAVGGTTNWSGYFVGNLYYGGALTPSDRRLKDNIKEIDYADALERVCATGVYTYRKFSAHMERYWPEQIEDRQGNLMWAEYESRSVVSESEIGPIAQELQDVSPESVSPVRVGDTEYLAVSDRSELYLLKAAVKHLVKALRDKGVDV